MRRWRFPNGGSSLSSYARQKKSSALKKVAAVKPAARRSSLLGDVRNLIIEARSQIARTVDTGLLFSNWQIGMRIRQDVLKLKRAAYGKQIVSTLSRQLEPEFGRGYSEKSLRHMHRLAEVFPDPEIVSDTVSAIKANTMAVQ